MEHAVRLGGGKGREMYCMHCGKEISDEAAFCQHCGNPVGEAALRQQAADFQPERKIIFKRTNSLVGAANVIELYFDDELVDLLGPGGAFLYEGVDCEEHTFYAFVQGSGSFKGVKKRARQNPNKLPAGTETLTYELSATMSGAVNVKLLN